MIKRHLVIMVKEPRLGRVKTRLAREIGKVPAWRFYRKQLERLPRKLHGPWQMWLASTPQGANRRSFPKFSGIRFMGQGKGDLGERMLYPDRVLPPGPFVLIGSDIPMVQRQHIAHAFKLLGKNDVVFGPATDGGFWLVAYKRHPAMVSPFGPNPVRWSHVETLQDCLKNLEGKKIGFVDTLSDVDDKASYLKVGKG